ncbi:MAG: hypothetical protein SFU86_18845 [Pirellulaceae bacterium]|nr:hypothetical protein [Pirellulaceae bacterium]
MEINPYAAPSVESAVLAAGPPPATFFQVLAAGTGLFVRRLPAVAAIMLVVWGPLELGQSYLETYVLDPDDVGTSFRLSMLLDALFGIIAVGAIVNLGLAESRGEPLAWWTCLGRGVAAWPRLFATRFVSGILLLLAALLLILPALYLAVRFSLGDTIAVAEGKAGMPALTRSLELTKGKFFWFTGLASVTVGSVLVFSVVTELPLIFFPDIHHWLLDAALTWLIDLFSAWMTLVYVAALLSVRASETSAFPPAAAATLSWPSPSPPAGEAPPPLSR